MNNEIKWNNLYKLFPHFKYGFIQIYNYKDKAYGDCFKIICKIKNDTYEEKVAYNKLQERFYKI